MATTASFRVASHRHAGPGWASPTAANDHGRWRPTSQTMLALMREAWRRRRSRQCLSTLNDHMLRDIGVTRAEAEHELNKSFWLK